MNSKKQIVLSSAICESNEPTTTPIQFGKLGGKAPECPPDSTALE
ncbi:hypothetical protein [Merismopedia glauca]